MDMAPQLFTTLSVLQVYQRGPFLRLVFPADQLAAHSRSSLSRWSAGLPMAALRYPDDEQ